MGPNHMITGTLWEKKVIWEKKNKFGTQKNQMNLGEVIRVKFPETALEGQALAPGLRSQLGFPGAFGESQ